MALPRVAFAHCRRGDRGGGDVRHVRRVERCRGERACRHRRGGRRSRGIRFDEDEDDEDHRLDKEKDDDQIHEPEFLGEKNPPFEELVDATGEDDRDDQTENDDVELLLLLSFDDGTDHRHETHQHRDEQKQARRALVLGPNIVIERIVACRC